MEHYYQPLMPAFFDDEQWTRVPATLRRGLAGQVFRRIFEEAAAAGETGAFDAATAHMDRMFIELDDPGRRELSDLLNDVRRQAQAIQERSDARKADGSERRMSEVAVLHFEPSSAAADPDVPKRSPAVPAA